MIFILTKESQSYLILAVVCMAGESSENAIALLVPQESYRQKILYKLLGDKLLYIYKKDGIKGYRLTKKGKETLLLIDYERFGFFSSDGADFSMRRSNLSHRQRQHRISETIAIMEKSGVEIYYDKKIRIFEEESAQPVVFSQSAFFHAKEVKAQGNLTKKMGNSRMTGVWLTSGSIWFCYNAGSGIMKWFENVERRADILVRSILKNQGMNCEAANAILFGENVDQALTYLTDHKCRGYILNSVFERFCFVPMNSAGTFLLRLLGDAEKYNYLMAVLSEDLDGVKEDDRIEHYGYNAEGEPVLICIDFDLKRLLQFLTQLRYLEKCGEIICFDFQKEVIESFCDERTKISPVDFETFRESFFPEG